MGAVRRGRAKRARSGALETSVGVVAVLAILLGVNAWLVAAVVGVLAGLDIAVTVARFRRRRRRLRTLEGFLALSPTGFEQAVAGLLRRLGYRHVRAVGGAGDLGVDIVCRGGAGELIVVQCKRYRPGHRVGSPDIQRFIGMAFIHHHAARAIFVTTSDYTQAARRLARDHPIHLIDGDRLVELAQGNPRPSTPLPFVPPREEVPVLTDHTSKCHPRMTTPAAEQAGPK
jgi:restriction system protein